MLAALAVAAFALGACGDEGAGQPILTHVDPGDEACATESQPTPELDAVAERLRKAGYRVRYAGYTALGYFTDESETTELCADSALRVEGNGLGRFQSVDVRQFEDPAKLDEMAADVATFPRLESAVADGLLYVTPAPKRKLDRVVAAAQG